MMERYEFWTLLDYLADWIDAREDCKQYPTVANCDRVEDKTKRLGDYLESIGLVEKS